MRETSIVPNSDTISWYWRRLKRVPLKEFPYRVSQVIKKTFDRVVQPLPVRTCGPDSVRINHLDLPTSLIGDARYCDDARIFADRFCDHRFDIFGQIDDFGTPIDWHLDPKTGNHWPLRFWGDINYRDGKTIGGIKFAWELNRLHHLPQLAIASVVTGDKKYERELFDQLRSWLSANPYPHGINWISGIELGIRLVNLVYALKILPDSPSPSDHETVSEFVYRHATHLYRYPSKHTSGANHALAEALGLFVAGTSFPGFDASSKWKQFGKDVLEREASRQIYPDGSSFEHSFPYLQFVSDHYLIYMLLCIEHDEQYSEEAPKRLQSAMRFINSILDDNGNFAAIGDDDSGYVMKLWFGEHNNFMSLLNTGAVLFADETLTGASGPPDQKTQLLLNGLKKIPARGQGHPQQSSDCDCEYFANAGIAIGRINHPVRLHFVGNSGPLGLQPLAAHGHADALSFWLSVNGQPVFVDPGTYLYHSGGVWRDYFRSTAAHNTIRIDETDQATMISDFMFDNFYDVTDARIEKEENRIIWSATHDGYRRLADPVSHRRTVILGTRDAKITIKDSISCAGNHIVESFLHFHPDCEIEIADREVRIHNGDSSLTLHPDKRWQQVELIRGSDDCSGGWYSREFNVLQKTSTLRFASTISGSKMFVTEINCSANQSG